MTFIFLAIAIIGMKVIENGWVDGWMDVTNPTVRCDVPVKSTLSLSLFLFLRQNTLLLDVCCLLTTTTTTLHCTALH